MRFLVSKVPLCTNHLDGAIPEVLNRLSGGGFRFQAPDLLLIQETKLNAVEEADYERISHKGFIKSFCKSQFPHKPVNLFSILVIIKNNLTDLCRNRLY